MAFDVLLRDPGTGFDVDLAAEVATNAQAVTATATASAENAGLSLLVPAAEAAASGLDQDTPVGVGAAAEPASGSGLGFDLLVLSSPVIEAAAALADAQGANGSHEVNAVEATAYALGEDVTAQTEAGPNEAFAECALASTDLADVGGGDRFVQAEMILVYARRAA